MSAPDNATHDAVRACAYWLAEARRIGWRQEDLDFLEYLWWQHHDERGRLKSDVARAVGAQEEPEK